MLFATHHICSIPSIVKNWRIDDGRVGTNTRTKRALTGSLPAPEPPPVQGSRSLVMVAKCLQNLANLVEFGGKEPYMEVVNPFIIKNRERMVTFLDQLSVRMITVIVTCAPKWAVQVGCRVFVSIP